MHVLVFMNKDNSYRSKYNEFGKAKAAGGEDGVIDPEAVFSR